MSDIDTVWDPDRARGDYVLAGADLKTGHDLETALLISLFSDRLARADDVLPDASVDRRGWWGDAGAAYPIGSRLWLLDRSKLTAAVAQKAEQFAAEALQWLIDDGVVAGFDISTQIILPARLDLTVKAFKTKDGKTANGYAWTWSGTILYPPAPIPAGRAPIVTEDGVELVTEDGLIIVA